MKLALFTTTLFVTMASFAAECPDLTGNFRCSAFGGFVRINVPISQETQGDITTYTLDGAPVIADGQSHQAETLPQIMANYVQDVNYTATCDASAVTFNGDGVSKKTGQRTQVKGVLTKSGPSTMEISLSCGRSV